MGIAGLVAGEMLVGRIVVELAFVRSTSVLHVFFVAAGIAFIRHWLGWLRDEEAHWGVFWMTVGGLTAAMVVYVFIGSLGWAVVGLLGFGVVVNALAHPAPHVAPASGRHSVANRESFASVALVVGLLRLGRGGRI